MSALRHLLHIDPLLFEPGDRMNREEFLAPWEQMPDVKNAELIDGTVYMPSPVSPAHADFDIRMHGLLLIYAWRTGICKPFAKPTWHSLDDAPQPDAVLVLLPEFGGTTRTGGKVGSGTPDLVSRSVPPAAPTI